VLLIFIYHKILTRRGQSDSKRNIYFQQLTNTNKILLISFKREMNTFLHHFETKSNLKVSAYMKIAILLDDN